MLKNNEKIVVMLMGLILLMHVNLFAQEYYWENNDNNNNYETSNSNNQDQTQTTYYQENMNVQEPAQEQESELETTVKGLSEAGMSAKEIVKQVTNDTDNKYTAAEITVALKKVGKTDGTEYSTQEIREALQSSGKFTDQEIDNALPRETTAQGTVNGTSTYDKDGNITGYQERVYSGDKIVSLTNYDKDGNVVSSAKYEYAANKSGVLLAETWYDKNNNQTDRVEYFYVNGKVETATHRGKNTDGKVDYRIKYTYDGNGNATKESYVDDKGNVLGYQTNEYMEKEGSWLITKSNYYDQANRLTGYSVYNYDKLEENGSGSVTNYDAGGNVESKYTFKWNKHGTTELIKYDANGNQVQKTTTEYNSNGSIAKQIVYGQDGQIEKMDVYEYDINQRNNINNYAPTSGNSNGAI